MLSTTIHRDLTIDRHCHELATFHVLPPSFPSPILPRVVPILIGTPGCGISFTGLGMLLCMLSIAHGNSLNFNPTFTSDLTPAGYKDRIRPFKSDRSEDSRRVEKKRSGVDFLRNGEQ